MSPGQQGRIAPQIQLRCGTCCCRSLADAHALVLRKTRFLVRARGYGRTLGAAQPLLIYRLTDASFVKTAAHGLSET